MIRPGAKVTLRKGARVWSTAPGWPLEGKVTTRSQAITIRFYDPGYQNPADGRFGPRDVPDRVRWAGAGGYWRWTDATNIDAAAAQSASCS